MNSTRQDRKVLRQSRRLEKKTGIACIKINMPANLEDGKNVLKAFREKCETNLVKTVDRVKQPGGLRKLALLT